MFSDSNDKLQQTRALLADLIADFDSLLTQIREARRLNHVSDGSDGEPDYVRRLAEQREILVTVVAMLGEMRVEWSQAAQTTGERAVED